jgi:hypothetical protein
LAPRSLTILALLATLSACAPDPSNPGATPAQIEDSAGVRIVTYAGTPTSAASFRFAAEPRYRHGTNPGDYAFQGAGTGRLLPDGGAIVYDEWNAELVVIEADGATHEVLAVEGEGPGDVGHIDALFALGQDSILMADPALGRITLFAGRAVARTWALPSMRYLRVKGIASPDDLLLATSWGPTGFAEAWAPGHLARFDMETSALDTVASFDLMAPFPPELEWDPIEPSGEVTVVAGHFVQTRSDMAQVTWRLADGTVTQIVRWRAAPALLTAESLEPIAAEHRNEVRMHDPGLSEATIAEVTERNMTAYRASIRRPLPLFGSPFPDDEGRVWLPSYRPGGERHSAPPYAVIASDGQWLGRVEAPPRFRILDVAAGLVLGVELDEMGVERVVVYDLTGR